MYKIKIDASKRREKEVTLVEIKDGVETIVTYQLIILANLHLIWGRAPLPV